MIEEKDLDKADGFLTKLKSLLRKHWGLLVLILIYGTKRDKRITLDKKGLVILDKISDNALDIKEPVVIGYYAGTQKNGEHSIVGYYAENQDAKNKYEVKQIKANGYDSKYKTVDS